MDAMINGRLPKEKVMTVDEKINELIDIVQSLIYDLRINEKDCNYYIERLIALKNAEPED